MRILALLALIFWPVFAQACSCAPSRQSDAELAARAAVFATGTVVSIRRATRDTFGLDRVKLRVVDAQKPVNARFVIVETANSDAMCGVAFVVGVTYRVVAFHEEVNGRRRAIATICNTRKAAN